MRENCAFPAWVFLLMLTVGVAALAQKSLNVVVAIVQRVTRLARRANNKMRCRSETMDTSLRPMPRNDMNLAAREGRPSSGYLANKSIHRACNLGQNLSPLFQMSFAIFGESVNSARRS